jgi:hypothetical protein
MGTQSDRERAHDMKRDRKREAGARVGMGTGLAKQFKVVMNEQEKRWKRDRDRREARESARVGRLLSSVDAS